MITTAKTNTGITMITTIKPNTVITMISTKISNMVMVTIIITKIMIKKITYPIQSLHNYNTYHSEYNDSTAIIAG